MQLLYVQLLAKFEIPEAVGSLVQAALVDSDIQVRDACLDALSRYGRDYAVMSYISVLRTLAAKPQGSAASVDQVNRAAMGLNALRADNAVLPLIEALVTEYKMTRKQQDNYNPNAFSMGGKAETTIEKSQNQEVLGALVKITGQNFGFDEPKWMRWYASVYAAPMGDLRRDP